MLVWQKLLKVPREYAKVLAGPLLVGLSCAALTTYLVAAHGLPRPLSYIASLHSQGQAQFTKTETRVVQQAELYMKRRGLLPINKPILFEFSDAQCPFCRSHEAEVEKIRSSGKCEVICVEFPLQSHPLAPYAAKLAILSEKIWPWLAVQARSLHCS